LFYFKKFSQSFFETLSYLHFLPPPPTGLVSQFFSDPSRCSYKFFKEYIFKKYNIYNSNLKKKNCLKEFKMLVKIALFDKNLKGKFKFIFKMLLMKE
jgi:hypothetical protein